MATRGSRHVKVLLRQCHTHNRLHRAARLIDRYPLFEKSGAIKTPLDGPPIVFDKAPSSRISCLNNRRVNTPVSNGFLRDVWFLGASIWGAVERVRLGYKRLYFHRRREPCFSVRSGRVNVSHCNLATRWSFCKRKSFRVAAMIVLPIDCPLPTNITGKSSVLPWQQEVRRQTTFVLRSTAHQQSRAHVLSRCNPAAQGLRRDPRQFHPRWRRRRLTAARRTNPRRPN